MDNHPFFVNCEEVGRDPRKPIASRPKVFPNTGALTLDRVEQQWARWDGGTLGDSGIDIWRVRSTGHSIDLVNASRWSFHLPLRGQMGLTFNRHDAEVREGHGALLGPAPRRTRVFPASDGIFDSLVLLVRPDSATLTGKAMSERTGLVTATDRGALSAYLLFLSQELMRPGSTIHAPSALRAAAALVVELYAATARAGAQVETVHPVGLSHVIHAEEIMRSRLDEPLTVELLARELGVSTRALQAAFKSHRSMTPREVLTTMRLDAAQRHLLSARPDETVTSIALACGFAHLSRFSEAYRRRFGELPSETLARVRRALPLSK